MTLAASSARLTSGVVCAIRPPPSLECTSARAAAALVPSVEGVLRDADATPRDTLGNVALGVGIVGLVVAGAWAVGEWFAEQQRQAEWARYVAWHIETFGFPPLPEWVPA